MLNKIHVMYYYSQYVIDSLFSVVSFFGRLSAPCRINLNFISMGHTVMVRSGAPLRTSTFPTAVWRSTNWANQAAVNTCTLVLCLPFTLIHHENGTFRERSSNCWNLKKGRFFVFVWTEDILKTKLFENDDVTIITWFPWPSLPQTQIQNGRWLWRL